VLCALHPIHVRACAAGHGEAHRSCDSIGKPGARETEPGLGTGSHALGTQRCLGVYADTYACEDVGGLDGMSTLREDYNPFLSKALDCSLRVPI
jgi:hypothetical protein